MLLLVGQAENAPGHGVLHLLQTGNVPRRNGLGAKTIEHCRSHASEPEPAFDAAS